MSSRISRCGNAAANSSRVGGVDLDALCPASVGAEISSKRHFGQSPCGASLGMGAPHFGQFFDSDTLLILLPEEESGKGYTEILGQEGKAIANWFKMLVQKIGSLSKQTK